MGRSNTRTLRRGSLHISDACDVMERLAPVRLAMDWDHVGLIAGDPDATLKRLLCCIDVTAAVIDEAVAGKYNLIVAYHPPIFKPIDRICADSPGVESLVFRCIAAGIAIYSPHTALDVAEGGTNDVLANICGMVDAQPLEYIESSRRAVKLVTFVPHDRVESVAMALHQAGAGVIGDYTQCSFRLSGTGTFVGGESTQPAVGQSGRLEHVDEIRLEVVVDTSVLPEVVDALRLTHPYDEPAFDMFPLVAPPEMGIGRHGRLLRSSALITLARKIKKRIAAQAVQIVGPADRVIERAVIVAGSAGTLPFKTSLDEQTVVITGEIRHHDALSYDRAGCCAIALNHWSSEKPVLASLAQRLAASLSGVRVHVSEADAEPFRFV